MERNEPMRTKINEHCPSFAHSIVLPQPDRAPTMSAERDTFRPAMPPPPISAKSKGKQKATDDVPDDNEADPLAKRKRLACEVSDCFLKL